MNIKKTFFTLLLCTGFMWLQAQELQTMRTEDWTKVWQSGFYEALDASTSPTTTTIGNHWYWGINVAHAVNNPNYRYNGQIVFAHHGIFPVPTVFIRSTDVNGNGSWAKVLTEEGVQKIKSDLIVEGKVHTSEIKVIVDAGADYVFSPDYPLKPLSEIEAFVAQNRHLPDIPSEKEMIEEGLNVNEFQIKLLQKIEELTLYTIQQQSLITILQEEMKEMKTQLAN